jgi:hypothetical protein
MRKKHTYEQDDATSIVWAVFITALRRCYPSLSNVVVVVVGSSVASEVVEPKKEF